MLVVSKSKIENECEFYEILEERRDFGDTLQTLIHVLRVSDIDPCISSRGEECAILEDTGAGLRLCCSGREIILRYDEADYIRKILNYYNDITDRIKDRYLIEKRF